MKHFESYDITLGLGALKKRLPPHHEKYPIILEELGRNEAGEKGEERVMALLECSELPKNTYVLHNVCFKAVIEVQIDVLIITPSWCLAMEVKNWNGSIYFNDNPSQVICEKDDQVKIYTNPESQLEQYCYGLEALLMKHQIKMPIYGLIVFPFNNAIIKKSPKKFPVKMGRDYLRYILSIQTDKPIADPKSVAKILQLNFEQWGNFPLCKFYEINPEHILTGVECPTCGTFPMKKASRTWYCPRCENTHMKAHVKSLNDYYMLIRNSISSQEAVKFLELRNRHEAKRIVKDNSISRPDNRRNGRYLLKFDKSKSIEFEKKLKNVKKEAYVNY